ncbi:MAG: hypothetical protein PHF21_02480, partial [Bacilli bacterium]|nr:hypothetical protein [Bacilli bacterium]
KEALMTLKEKGYKLIFITARGSDYEFFIDYDYVGVTEEIFKKYNIPYDKIIYRCYPKGLKAKEEKIDIFIDDKEENLDDISKHGIKCIKKVDNLTNKSNYKQFDNWEDILKYILKLEGELNGK